MGTQHQSVFELDPQIRHLYHRETVRWPRVTFLKKPRETSQIEQRIMGKVMTRAYEELELSWRQVAELKFRESSFESNAEFVQIIPGSEAAIVVTFRGDRPRATLLHQYLLPVPLDGKHARSFRREKLDRHDDHRNDARRESRQYEESVQTVDVELCAELGQTQR